MPGHWAAQVVGQPPRRLSYILPESQVKLFSSDHTPRSGKSIPFWRLIGALWWGKVEF